MNLTDLDITARINGALFLAALILTALFLLFAFAAWLAEWLMKHSRTPEILWPTDENRCVSCRKAPALEDGRFCAPCDESHDYEEAPR